MIEGQDSLRCERWVTPAAAWRDRGTMEVRLGRPKAELELHSLVGGPSKAHERDAWTPSVNF
jgi:hypothetical protein